MWPGIIQAAGQANSSGQAIQLLPGQRLGTINAGLFGFMIEPFGRNVEGVWVGEDSSIPSPERLSSVGVVYRPKNRPTRDSGKH